MLLLVDQKGIQRHLRPQAETAHKAIQIAPGVQLSPGIRVLLKQAELRLLELLAQRLLQLAHGVLHLLHALGMDALPALGVDVAVKKLFNKFHSFFTLFLSMLHCL